MTLHKRIVAGILWITLLALAITGCGQVVPETGNTEAYERDLFALDTYITFRIYGDEGADLIIDKAIHRIQEIEERMSITIEDSDVSNINRNAGKAPVKVHNDTLEVINRAMEFSQMTEGIFDITIYPLVKLWGVTAENPVIPTSEEIEKALALVDYTKVIVDNNEGTVYLEDEGMGIDLGGIAKGYAADEALKILRQAGIENALLNLGGDIVTIGDKPDGTPWRIGIQDPRWNRQDARKHFAIVDIADRTIVSSGDYERYMIEEFERTGERYHHILDPRTGYPAKSGLISTTIIENSSMDADALSTAVFIMGIDRGMELIDSLDDTGAILVDEDKNVFMSEGVKEPFEIVKPEYAQR